MGGTGRFQGHSGIPRHRRIAHPTTSQDGDFHPAEGLLDAPSEALLRVREAIVSNMNFPFAYTVNKAFGVPASLLVIRLKDAPVE